MAAPRRVEWLGTYFVPNNEKKAEIARLQIEDGLFTSSMGGPLSEQTDPAMWRAVLDIGCGIGDWSIELARQYPLLVPVGIDINRDVIEIAQTRAEASQGKGRATFLAMDALEPLGFANQSFDLVNMRLGSTFVRIWDWSALLNEILRVLRPGGIVRFTEAELTQESTSAVHAHYWELFLKASFNAGRLFERKGDGLTAYLPHLLDHYGLRNVSSVIYPFVFKSGTAAGKTYYTYFERGHTILPFLQKWGSLPQDVETIFQQALSDIQHKGFQTTWNVKTIWGSKP